MEVMSPEKKIDKKLEKPQLASPYVVALPQPPARNAEEYLKAYIGYVYTAVGAIAQEVASIELHLYKATFTKNGIKTQEVFEHPAISCLDYVNEISTFYDLVEATQTYLELTGEAYWIILKDGTIPREVWLVRPDWMKVIPSKTEVIDHYNYYAGGVLTEKVEIPKENVIPFKYFNPLNPYRGKGTVNAAALPFDILNFAQEYNRNFFFNSAIPSMVFSTEQKITQTTVKRFLDQWQNTFGGRSKSNKVAFLGSGMKLDKASMGAKELDFTEQMKMMRDDVLAVFKVPKTVLGLTEDVNKANAQATTMAFMERVITPRMRKFVNTVNEFFLPMFTEGDNTLFFDFVDPSPEDVDIKLKRYDSGLTNHWMTPNEVRVEENLEPLPGGDELFPAKEEANQDQEQEGQDVNEDTDQEEKPTAEEESMKGWQVTAIKLLGGIVPKTVHKRSLVRSRSYLDRVRERKVKHMVKLPAKPQKQLEKEIMIADFAKVFKGFVADLASTDEYKLLVNKKSKKKATLEDKFNMAFDKAVKSKIKEEPSDVELSLSSGWTEEQKQAHWAQFIKQTDSREAQIKQACRDIFQEQKVYVLERLYDQHKSFRKWMGYKSTASTVVPSAEELNKMWRVLEDLLREIYIEQGTETLDFLGTGGIINITTEFASQYLLEWGGQLIIQIDDTTRSALMASLSEGYDKGESVDELAKRVESVYGLADSNRAEMIARTESIRASNAATVEAYRQSGVVTAKEWLTERDNRTCPFCLKLDGKAIGLSTNFFNKGDTFKATDENGKEVELKIDLTNVGEPPVHPDCRCTTIPVIDTSTQAVDPDDAVLKSDVEELVTVAKDQDAGFQASVKNIASTLEAKALHGPVKSVDRILEKIRNDYLHTNDPIGRVLDTNRATLLINDPKDFQKVVDTVQAEFGNVYRVKDKFALEGYKSGIINVTGKNGVVSEIAVTTPEMWDAKEDGGGHKLYESIRAGKDATGELQKLMDELYVEAQRKVDERLNEV
jgi:HK97 family phage portal protein